jgi:hypothetical protein
MQLERTIAVVLVAAAALGGLASLLVPEPGRAGARPFIAKRVAPAVAKESEGSAVLACSSSVAPSPSAALALAAIARKVGARAAAASETARLERELLASPSEPDKVGLRVRLERLLRERPELAPAAARAFARLDDRESLFAISRALVGCADQPEVRAVLDAAAASGPAARREVALIALPPDAPALALAGSGLADASAAPTVRAASAYALARGYDALPESERASSLGTARALAGTPSEDPHLRAEAFHLLARAAAPGDASSSDASLAAAALAEPGANAELALAAAHLALATGAASSDVAAALARFPERACALAATQLTSPRSGP